MIARQLTAPKNLPGRVERTVVERGTIAVWYLGGAGLILKTPETIVYVDPYVGEGTGDPELGGRTACRCRSTRGPPAGSTRCSAPTTTPTTPTTTRSSSGVSTSDRRCSDQTASIDLAREWGYPVERLRTLQHGERAVVNDVQVTSVRAYDPLAKGANGYLVEAQGVSLLHLGDSLYYKELGEEVAGRPIDALFVSVAQNPRGKNYYMTESDAGSGGARRGRTHRRPDALGSLAQLLDGPQTRCRCFSRWYCPEVTVTIPQYGRKMVVSHTP